jgi:hypothetical protein
MASHPDPLVDFLLDTTGDRLYVVLQYDELGWELRYVREEVRERIAAWEDSLDAIVGQFRAEADRSAEREGLFDVGSFYCTLHLYEDLILIHFSQPGHEGVLFGYDPDAAANLTSFVELCLPRIRQHALPDVGEPPAW